MPFITFIYRFKGNPNTYHGKYCFDYISDDHEGLDIEVKYVLKTGLNLYRVTNDMPKVKKLRIGIISYSSNEYIPTYSTEKEIKCFDFYCTDYNDRDSYSIKKYYIDGKPL